MHCSAALGSFLEVCVSRVVTLQKLSSVKTKNHKKTLKMKQKLWQHGVNLIAFQNSPFERRYHCGFDVTMEEEQNQIFGILFKTKL